jgi:large subunit ribosomal protein L30
MANAKTSSGAVIRVTQTRSKYGRLKNHQDCIAGLGLRRIGHTVELEDTPAVRGMINKVNYMVRVEEAS